MSRLIPTREVNRQIGYHLSVDQIKELGFKPVMETKTTVMWDSSIAPAVILEMISVLAKRAHDLARNYPAYERAS